MDTIEQQMEANRKRLFINAVLSVATDFIVLERGRVIRQMTRAELEEAIGKGGDVEAYFLSILEENRGG